MGVRFDKLKQNPKIYEFTFEMIPYQIDKDFIYNRKILMLNKKKNEYTIYPSPIITNINQSTIMRKREIYKNMFVEESEE